MSRSLLAAVVAAFAVLAPAAAQAAPTLSFDAPCYSPGDRMSFTGVGYTPGGDVTLTFATPGNIGTYATKADAAGAIADYVDTPKPDDFVEDDDYWAVMGVAASDMVRVQAGAPQEEQFGAALIKLSRFEVAVEQPGGARVKARKPMQITAVGFTHARGDTLYAHYVRGGRRAKTLKIGRLAGDCGDRRRTVPRALPRGLRPGSYKLVFNTSASNARSTPNYWHRLRLR